MESVHLAEALVNRLDGTHTVVGILRLPVSYGVSPRRTGTPYNTGCLGMVGDSIFMGVSNHLDLRPHLLRFHVLTTAVQ